MVSDAPFLFIANHSALDFVNTELIQAHTRIDLLEDAESVVHWLAAARLLIVRAPTQALELFPEPRERAKLLTRARELRSALRALIDQRGANKRTSAKQLEPINALLRLGGGSIRLASTSDGIERRVEHELHDTLQLLQPVASAAVELLCDVDRTRIKPCANHECILYFLDISKNQTRRWCSMGVCGNRTKVAAHYRRQRDEED
jgi:predicted RNA-binding Zn ribbon-like protein